MLPQLHGFSRVLILAWLTAILPAGASVPATPPDDEARHPVPPPFCFVAIGCMPYSRLPDSAGCYARVLAETQRHRPAFVVHLGDILGSEEPCTDETLLRRRKEFDSIDPALVFTPGDNEWTDVHRTGRSPLERLQRIRELFFATETSRGLQPIPLRTQRRDPAHALFVENARWTQGTVVFATVHVVGSANNRQTNIAGAMEEWQTRDLANIAWVRDTFAEARRDAAPGVVLFFQANPIPGHPGFAAFLESVATETRRFGRPVLLVHADEHRYRLEPGFRPVPNAPALPNLTRLETFGASDFHGVVVTVDPASAAVFLPGPLLVPGNPLPRLPRPAPPAR